MPRQWPACNRHIIVTELQPSIVLPLCNSQERNKQARSHEMQEHTCSLLATHNTPYLFPKTPYAQGYQILAGRESLVIGHIQSLYGHPLVYTHETKNSFPAKVTFIKIKMYELFTVLFVLWYLPADLSLMWCWMTHLNYVYCILSVSSQHTVD